MGIAQRIFERVQFYIYRRNGNESSCLTKLNSEIIAKLKQIVCSIENLTDLTSVTILNVSQFMYLQFILYILQLFKVVRNIIAVGPLVFLFSGLSLVFILGFNNINFVLKEVKTRCININMEDNLLSGGIW